MVDIHPNNLRAFVSVVHLHTSDNPMILKDNAIQFFNYGIKQIVNQFGVQVCLNRLQFAFETITSNKRLAKSRLLYTMQSKSLFPESWDTRCRDEEN